MEGLLQKKKKKEEEGLPQSTSLKKTFPLPYIYGKPNRKIKEGSASSQRGFSVLLAQKTFFPTQSLFLK